MNAFNCPRNAKINKCSGCEDSAYAAVCTVSQEYRLPSNDAAILGLAVVKQVRAVMEAAQPLSVVDEEIMTCSERRQAAADLAESQTRRLLA